MMSFFGRFSRADEGVSAIEFALVAPIMLATFFGVAEISNFILAARKVANVASTAADLVTQDTIVTDGEMNDIMGALDVILRPFDPNSAQIRITSVVADADGETTVAWSDARNTSPYAVNSPIVVPDDIVPPNQGVVMAEVSFTYQTLMGMYLTNGATVDDTFYLKPRRSTKVLRQ
jgi:Flp pilus assembly protein TadG